MEIVMFHEGRTIPVEYDIPRGVAAFGFPDQEEGFDEIRVAKPINGIVKWMCYEKRIPMYEYGVGPDGEPCQKLLGLEFFTIKRAGSMGVLMRQTAFERFLQEQPESAEAEK